MIFSPKSANSGLFGQIYLYVYEILSEYKNLYGNIFQNVLYYRRNLEKSPCGSRE